MTKPRVYLAGKTIAAQYFETLKEEYPAIVFTARWPKHVVAKRKETPEEARSFWVENHDDIADSNFVLLWAQVDDRLEGALVEAGMGIAFGKTVVLTGYYPYRTWQHHPLCVRYPSILRGLDYIIHGK